MPFLCTAIMLVTKMERHVNTDTDDLCSSKLGDMTNTSLSVFQVHTLYISVRDKELIYPQTFLVSYHRNRVYPTAIKNRGEPT